MKSILSVALLSSLGLWATAVEAWDTQPPPSSCGSSTFPATGQITPATGTMTQTGATVRDDGFVKAGGVLSYRDNGDGTISDLNTGLMWEKKSADGSDHDVTKVFPWSSLLQATIWDWIDAINTEVANGIGFAGFNDWRIPNVRELQSIVDYGRLGPAVDPVFNNNVSTGCTVLTCSATRTSTPYWSSTTVATVVVDAWPVDFGVGFNFPPALKGESHAVRAVRGGCVMP